MARSTRNIKEPARSSKRSTSSNGSRRRQQEKSDYTEDDNYGSVFQRVDAKGSRPNFTGEGVLSEDTLDKIREADGKFQISLWTMNRDGEPYRNRDGTRRFRLHIEPSWEGDQDDDEDDDDGPDDIPF